MDDKKKVKFVFVILTYRTSSDLSECLNSIEKNFDSYKVIVVNSFYDTESENAIFDIANEHNCDYFSVENKGYSYGNNKGISYCKEKYIFDYLIICNPDIVVEQNNIDYKKYDGEILVLAPIIRNLVNKMQNPYWAIDNKIGEHIIYEGYKHRNRLLLYFAFAMNKVLRWICNTSFKYFNNSKEKRIYACHGSFVMFSSKLLEKFDVLYDDNMFLFAEEAYIARVFKNFDIPIIYNKNLIICHKEDGSMSVEKIDEKSELRKSVMYYYEKLRVSLKNDKGE